MVVFCFYWIYYYIIINSQKIIFREMLIREDVDIQTSAMCIAEQDHRVKLNTTCC